MPFIVEKTLSWTAGASTDVVLHRVFIVPESEVLDYNSTSVDVPVGTNILVLPSIFDLSEEGNYKIGVCSQDDAGNMSDIDEVTRPLDFSPPAPPTNVEIISS